MPTFDFTSPEGKTYSVDGPEGATKEQAFQMLQQHLGATPSAPSVGLGEDVAKSLGSGLAQGTINALGSAGNFAQAASRGTDWLGNKLGINLSPVKTAASMTPFGLMASAPTSADIKSTITNPIVSPDYEPQSGTGDYLKTFAEFAPAALISGEGGLARRALQAAVPAITSETAGKLTQGTALEPYARAAGAFVSPSGGRPKGPKLTGEGLVAQGGKQFDQARDMNLIVSPEFTTNTAETMRQALKSYDSETNPVFKVIDRLDNLGKPAQVSISPAQRLQAEMNWEKLPQSPPPSPVSMNDVELARKQLSMLRKSSDGPTRSAAKEAQDILASKQASLTPADVISGDANAYAQTLQNAIGNYGAGKRQQTIQGKMNLAELNANSPVGMLDSATAGEALQRTMKQLARPINNTNVPIATKLGFNKPEVEAITKIANGNKLTDIAQILERAKGGPFTAIPALMARQIGGLSIKRQVKALNSLVLSRSPHALQVAAQLPTAAQQLSNRAKVLLGSAVNAGIPLRSAQDTN